jgi:acyl-CoA synthetase (NDP forming)
VTGGTTPRPRAVDHRRLDRLFFPRRIAIAGLSPRPEAWGRAAYQYLRAGGFTGEVVALRPRQPDPDVPGVDSLADAGPIDVLIVAIPAKGAVEVIAETGSDGADVGGAVVFSSGFAEEGHDGRALQDQLVAAAGELPFLGPNCLGLVSDPGHVVVSVSGFLGRERRAGPVALVSQSGAMGFVLAEQLRRRGVGFSYYVSTGNEAALGVADLVGYLAQRPEVRVLGCYLEGVRDVDAWRGACRQATAMGCKVVALKVGSTVAAQRAALSHTASAAGEAELFEAVCREEGVTLVGDEVTFAEAVCALGHPSVLPARPGLGVITMSGGAGAMIADQVGVVADVPELLPVTRAALQALDVGLAGDGNPVDLTGMFNRHLGRLDEVIGVVGSDPSIDAIALYFTFGDRMLDAYRALARHLADLPVPTWFVWAGAPDGEVPAQAETARVVATIPDLVRSLAAQPRTPPAAVTGALEVRASRRSGPVPAGPVLTETVVGPALAAAGMPYVALATGRSAEEVLAAVEQIVPAPPWVVKVDHPGAPHRARLGLVAVGVADRTTLEGTVDRFFQAAREQGLDGARVVVEPMVTSVGAMALGALVHREYGPVLLVGPGGAQVEEARARRIAACLPLSARGLEAVRQGVEVIVGAPVDLDAVADAVVALDAFMSEHPEVTEVDVNPVLVTPESALVAVDALAVVGDQPGSPSA